METAVEWLERRFYFTNGQLIDIDFEQAKQMEKEQIMEGWDDGCYQSSDFPKTSDAENYYNKTFKSE